MKKAFTLIELLVVIAIIAILAAILFPVFAQAKVAAKKTKSLAELKQVGTATAIYLGDYDDLYPLAYGWHPSIGWGHTYLHDVPADWYPGNSSAYLSFVGAHPANSTEPYRKNMQLLKVDGRTSNITGDDFSIAVKSVGEVGYTFNGLLQSYSSTAMERISNVPMWTSFYGNINIQGYGLSDPQLYCPNSAAGCTYVPTTPTCDGDAQNGAWTYAITLDPMGSHHIYGNGENWVHADTSAKFKKLGMSYGGASDFNNDPYTQYKQDGTPGGGWYDANYCHMYHFAPDWDGTIVGTPVEELWP
ncbi:MAG: prepilin-type N-terminal cleavage/methylation domain-containing protein [Fimbriimonadaceae bacterium]|nr:MAG: prepilin-type N-terminal cleavage/methylation domain-containing protein [Fimbriimonadaceae bacterium]